MSGPLKAATVYITADTVDGGYVALLAELPGCVSQGETIGEALRNIAEAFEGVSEREGES